MGKSQGAKLNLKRSATQASDPSNASRVVQDVNGRVRSGRRPQATEIAAIFTRGRAALGSENGDLKNMKRLARDAKAKKSANSAEKSVQQLPRARNRDKANNPTTLNGHKNARVVFVQPHSKGENRTPKDELQKSKEKRKRKRRKKVDAQEVTEDAASKLKKRVKYLFIRMRLEQNFIDAYSNEGWKGQSREKVRPEKELQRAGSQILRYKLAIRDAIRELDLLCQEGAIQEAAFDSEGQIDSEEIFCAICGSHEALIDNDIILCDGACNRGFHQKCLCPPLENEDIPPGDEGWLCNACDSKLDCLYTINDYLGTNFEVESKWEEIFPEAANPPGGMDDDLLSDDSEDDDYDPEGQEKENVEADMGPEEGSDSSSFSASSGSSSSDSSDSDESECNLYDDEPDFNKTSADAEQAERKQGVKGRAKRGIAAELEEIDDGETVVSGKRQRPEVDYKKLNDEMFGKNDSDSDQQSEDMDWGPGRRESQRKTCGDHEENTAGSIGKMRRKKEVKAGPSDHDAENIPKQKKTKIPSDALEAAGDICEESTTSKVV